MFCSKCGKEIMDEAVICPGCGCVVQGEKFNQATSIQNSNKVSTSLILGIVGIVFAWIFALIGHITSIISIVLGIKEYKETSKMTGLILGIVGEVCSIFSSIIGAVTFTNILY